MNFKSVDEILQFAIDREKEAVKFYASLGQEAPSEALKQTFIDFSSFIIYLFNQRERIEYTDDAEFLPLFPLFTSFISAVIRTFYL